MLYLIKRVQRIRLDVRHDEKGGLEMNTKISSAAYGYTVAAIRKAPVRGMLSAS